MRITIPVDPAYAFDYLSILEIKLFYGMIVGEELEAVRSHIQSIIGNDLYGRIITSKEYSTLYLSNGLVFKMVGKAEKDECKASEVTSANHERYLAKLKLQAAFFPGTAVNEVKSGKV